MFNFHKKKNTEESIMNASVSLSADANGTSESSPDAAEQNEEALKNSENADSVEGSENPENSGSPEKSTKQNRGSFGDIMPKLICVLAAVLVWFYVSGEQSIAFEKEFHNIGVAFDAVGALEKQGYTIISGNNATVDITVSGARSEVNGLSHASITPRCDLSGIFGPGEYTVPVKCDIPGNITVVSVVPETVVVYVDRSTQKEIPVIASVTTGGTADLSIKIEELEPDFDTVRVTGPDEELAKISHAAVDIALAGLIEKSTEWTGSLYLVDKNGEQFSNAYVNLDKTTVKVLVPVNKYKTVPISVAYDGPEASELGHDVVLSAQTVEIRGNKDIIDAVESIRTESIDISGVRGETSMTVKLVVPPGIELTDIDRDTVTVSIVPHNNNSASITTANIVMINIPEGMRAMTADSSVTFEFFGTLDAISKLKPENVFAVADLSACSEAGDYEVVLDVNYPEAAGITLAGKYTAKITIY